MAYEGYNGYLTAATFIIELTIFTYYSYRFASNRNLRIRDYPELFWTLMIILFLSMYQLSEILSCSLGYTKFGVIFGYMVITWLPAFGLYLVNSVGIRTFHIEKIALFVAATFNIYFVTNSNSVMLLECFGQFVAYSATKYSGEYYGYYYIGALILAIGFLGSNIRKEKSYMSNPIIIILSGYLAFTLPTFINVEFLGMDRNLVTSFMCQWALGLALILGYYLKLKNRELQKLSAIELEH